MVRKSQRQQHRPPQTETKATEMATRSKAVTKEAVVEAAVIETTSKTAQKAQATKIVEQVAAIPTASVPTSHAQTITMTQSSHLSKIMIYTTISSIAWLRDLFPPKCFERCTFIIDPEHWTYEQFSTGAAETNEAFRKTKYACLRRGRKPELDTFLNCMEKGVFDALDKGILSGFRIDLSEISREDSEVLESYFFTCIYKQNADGTRCVEDIEIVGTGSHGQKPTVINIKLDMEAGIRRIIELCNTLPVLPTKMKLNIYLYLAANSDPKYCPPGFDDSTRSKISHAEAAEWKMITTSTGATDMGHFATSLRVSHLVPTGNAGDTDTVPSDLRYGSSKPEEDDLDIGIAKAIDVKHQHMRRISKRQASSTQNIMAEALSATHLPSADDKHAQLLRPMSRRSLSQLNVNQDSHDRGRTVDFNETQVSTQAIAGRAQLKNMLLPGMETQSIEETQVITPESAYTKLLDFVAYMPKLWLSNSSLERLKKHRSLVPPGNNSKRRMSGLDGEIVDCECGHNEEDSHMMQCDYCDRWQHSVCYGYVGEQDRRLPDVHACYACLLAEREPAVRRKLGDLTLLRKAIMAIIHHGYNKDLELSKQMNCSLKAAANAVKHLKRIGHVLTPPKGKKNGSMSSCGSARFVAVVDEPGHTSMMNSYFDPTMHIKHHFELPQSVSGTAKTKWTEAPPDIEMSDEVALVTAHQRLSKAVVPSPKISHAGKTNNRKIRVSSTANSDSSNLHTSIRGNTNPTRTPNGKRDFEDFEDIDPSPVRSSKRLRKLTQTVRLEAGYSNSAYANSNRGISPA
ncbi:hypothetical protein EJ08DRAFT_696121 [Tothia fuscella]|uniref:HORMA domain-containing protein n=1 Tax=Tothia fuscella TaxID=1048955 RepID=A0A9P4NTX0_9PEZI|nr:hypothetical protein EJ08DRAFT_696121 [Tothia fuscella]